MSKDMYPLRRRGISSGADVLPARGNLSSGIRSPCSHVSGTGSSVLKGAVVVAGEGELIKEPMRAVGESLPMAGCYRGPHAFSERAKAGEEHVLGCGLVADKLGPEVGLHAL